MPVEQTTRSDSALQGAPCPQADHINDKESALLDDANSEYSSVQVQEIIRRNRRRGGKNSNDIKAPDGYTLGGLRRVRKDGTILFQRGWWQAPIEWAGEDVWVHEKWYSASGYGRETDIGLEVAPPGWHIYEARLAVSAVLCERTDRPDAKPGIRNEHRKAWSNRIKAISDSLE